MCIRDRNTTDLAASTADGFKSLDTDGSINNDPSLNWAFTATKSSQECTGDATTAMLACSKVNVHFWRNFDTSQLDQDVQFSLADDVGVEFNVGAFWASYSSDDFGRNPQWSKQAGIAGADENGV